ncbi:DUF2634 domain-containing protein [Lapidilactobacillus bayanensis]|uniref:DUF2634 domain-containing protein n=1 Tax=Lapidilactobacillus bayanensis TaxID=2485998 RepID=UPI000F78056F|nr:DUF2634 domain-containing protein [Lapidilactobacillus bayanensis]
MDNDLFQDEIENSIEEVTLPTLTYQVVNGRVQGMIDEQTAMRQAIDKILRTERFVFPIYDDQYGNDFIELIGKDMPYAKNEVQRMINEALLGDDRVVNVNVDDIQEIDASSLEAKVTVETIFGDFDTKVEVTM